MTTMKTMKPTTSRAPGRANRRRMAFLGLSLLALALAGAPPAQGQSGQMIVSDRDPTLGVNAWGGAVHGASLKLNTACQASNPDCTWTYRNGMLVSDRDPTLAINAWGGATEGVALRLHNGCQPSNPDCTWTYRNGMYVSNRDPTLAINAAYGAKQGADLVLTSACRADNPDCRWSFAPARAPANIALRPFNVLVLGDSYMSQPGLLPEERSWSLVAAHFTSLLAGFRESRPPRVFARSGAEIRIEIDTPDNMEKDREAPWPGEGVPDAFWEDQHPNGDTYSSPSIWRQLTRAYCDSTRRTFVKPSEVDLVLVDGGGNDVGITAIMNPFRAGNGQEWLRQLTRDVLGLRMKPLLQQVASAFPSARIVVMGYPQLISNQTDVGGLMIYLGVLGVLAGGPVGGALAILPPAIKNTLQQQTQAFAEESSKELQLAVDEANATHRGRLVFADVRTVWTEANAYGAPESHFWVANAPATPPDHTHGARYEICKTHGKIFDMATDGQCAQGAAGHPNVEGARAHASAAIAALEKFGVGWLGLKAGEPLDDKHTPNPTFTCNPPPRPRGPPRPPGPIPQRP